MTLLDIHDGALFAINNIFLQKRNIIDVLVGPNCASAF